MSRSEKLYSASLRIVSEIGPGSEFFDSAGIVPTHSHKKGDSIKAAHPYGSCEGVFDENMWIYTPPVSKSEALEVHLYAIGDILTNHKELLFKLGLMKSLSVSCSCNLRHSAQNFRIPNAIIQIFSEFSIELDFLIIDAVSKS